MTDLHEREADPLLAGFYTIRDAARFLNTGNQAKLRSWLDGWRSSKLDPVIQRDFEHSATVSFLDLMELRFIQHFRRVGVPLQTLRKSAENARRAWNEKHPFALSRDRYLSNRREIFAQTAEEQGDLKTLNLATNQYEMWAAIEELIDQGLTFDPSSNLAKTWQPRAEFKNIIMDPHRAFGAPSIKDLGIPTKALLNQYKAEAVRGGFERVASWFGIEQSYVEEAVKFEVSLVN